MKKRASAKGKKELRRKLMAAVLFLVKFNLLALPMYAVMSMDLTVQPLQSFVASSVHLLLQLLGHESVVKESILLFSSGQSVVAADMTFDCIGWKSMYTLFALAAATPKIEWKRKLKFLAAGLPAIFAINILRIVTTIAAVISFGTVYLEIVHSILWQEGLVAVVVGIWYFWLKGTKALKT